MKKINVLSIGNSFSQDAQKYLHDLARSEGVVLETINLYIAGCSLERHYRNMMGNKRYALEVNGHSGTGFLASIEEALLAREWDVITLQQASRYSYEGQTYFPYINELANYVRKFCPKAKLYIHQTWGYESGSELIQKHGFQTYDEMFGKIRLCYEEAAERIGADGIIPCGLAFLYAGKLGIKKVHRDMYHANLGVGRFILALVWYGYITGNEIGNIGYSDFAEPVSEEEYKIALEAAAKALNYSGKT